MSRGGGGLGFLTDRAQLVRRFVLAEVLGPPRGRGLRMRPRARPAAPAAAPAAAPVAAPKPVPGT